MKDLPTYEAFKANPLDFVLTYSILGPTIRHTESETSLLISEATFDIYRGIMSEARKQ